jgi:hypothetical protein
MVQPSATGHYGVKQKFSPYGILVAFLAMNGHLTNIIQPPPLTTKTYYLLCPNRRRILLTIGCIRRYVDSSFALIPNEILVEIISDLEACKVRGWEESVALRHDLTQ